MKRRNGNSALTADQSNFDTFDVKSLLHPAEAFAHPSDVVNDCDLTLSEKRAILSLWASDSCAVEADRELRRIPRCSPVSFDGIMDGLRLLDRQAAQFGKPIPHYRRVLARRCATQWRDSRRLDGSGEQGPHGEAACRRTYVVDEAGHTLTLHIQGSTYPNWDQTMQKRQFTVLSPGDLKWETPDPSSQIFATFLLVTARRLVSLLNATASAESSSLRSSGPRPSIRPATGRPPPRRCGGKARWSSRSAIAGSRATAGDRE